MGLKEINLTKRHRLVRSQIRFDRTERVLFFFFSLRGFHSSVSEGSGGARLTSH